jgi:hypothetical protein
MKDENSLKRLNILEKSLRLESLLSDQLSKLFRIQNKNDSISFGQTGQSLSFSQKVNLLLDTRDISKDERKDLQCFMEIRNKFIHNLEISTYEQVCVETKKVNFLKKKYPECFQNKKIETNLKKSIDKLFKNCFEAIA